MNEVKGNVLPSKLPLSELLVQGLYARALFIPADSKVVGAAKKKEYITMVVKGTVVITEAGVTTTYTAPAMMKSPPGTTRELYAVDAVVVTTFHGTNVTSTKYVEEDILLEGL